MCLEPQPCPIHDLWSCRDCQWQGVRPGAHEQETEQETGVMHWTLCPEPS